jgi:cellulose synthase/poly-beta-1,6-N-acetylglucosamine synthase-like glycosyltransferase
VPRSTIDDFFYEYTPPMTVIIPSYREDERIIRQTLLTVALQEYADLRVVLLVDDPPNPKNPEHARILEESRAISGTIMELLRGPREEFEAALANFRRQRNTNPNVDPVTLKRLSRLYNNAADWFARQREATPIVDHTDRFLADEFLGRMATDLRMTATAISEAAADSGAVLSRMRAEQLYLRLVRIFQADLTSFERKQFASLSHDANKAMNLNSYLGLMGEKYCIQPTPGGRVLVPAKDREPDLVIPNADYVLTLDADTMLLPEYCLRMVYFMEQDENADVAVVQTPYSSYRGSPSNIERIAGATTDVQHILHQGLTHYNATFWVGANAVLRKEAIDELREDDDEGGFVISRFIRDRTLIEDTESSIDLRVRGWRLYNYPERLSYSATPPDFGSLVIQRQRWANGGLVILPTLLKLAFGRHPRAERPGFAEFFLRTNYLASISWATVGLLFLLFYPFAGALLSSFAKG